MIIAALVEGRLKAVKPWTGPMLPPRVSPPLTFVDCLLRAPPLPSGTNEGSVKGRRWPEEENEFLNSYRLHCHVIV